MEITNENQIVALVSIPALAPLDENLQTWTIEYVRPTSGYRFATYHSGYDGNWRNILVNHEHFGMEIHPDAIVAFFNRTDDNDPDLADFYNTDIEEIIGRKEQPYRKVVSLKRYADVLTRRGVHWEYATEWIERNRAQFLGKIPTRNF